MSKYIISVLTVAIIGGIVSTLVASKRQSLKKHINFIIGLISAIVFLSPIIKVINSAALIKNELTSIIEEITDNSEISNANGLIVTTSTERITNNIKEAISKRFGFEASDIYVSAELNKSNIEAIEITSIRITISNEASWSDTEPIKSYVEELIGVKTVVKRS